MEIWTDSVANRHQHDSDRRKTQGPSLRRLCFSRTQITALSGAKACELPAGLH